MQIETIDDIINTLETYRIRKGLTERELSKAIGKDPTHYWGFKNKTKNMTTDAFLKYCNVLSLKITLA